MTRITYLLIAAFNVLTVIYLVSPTPTLPPLVNAVKSDLPGDTIQLKNVSAYFTNQTRTEVINFYKGNYGGLFRIKLNHPPEKAKEIIRDTTQTYYLEEFILPFKESVFVNGYEWQNDVFTKPDKRIVNKILYNKKEYSSKVTIKIFPTSIAQRLFSFFYTEASIIIIIFLLRKYIFRR